MLKTFTGFKGSIAFAEIGGIQFVIMAKTNAQLAVLWDAILAEAGPLDPAGIKKAIIIEATDLPCSHAKLVPAPSKAPSSSSDTESPTTSFPV